MFHVSFDEENLRPLIEQVVLQTIKRLGIKNCDLSQGESVFPQPKPMPSVRAQRVDKNPDGWMTVKDAMEFMGLKSSKVYLLMRDESIHARKVGNRTLISKQSVIDFMDDMPTFNEARGR